VLYNLWEKLDSLPQVECQIATGILGMKAQHSLKFDVLWGWDVLHVARNFLLNRQIKSTQIKARK